MGSGILIRSRSRSAYVLWDDIYYIMKDLRRVFIFTKDDEYWEYGSMEQIGVLDDERFYQCHKSLIVNLDKLLCVTKDHIVMIDGNTVHMCRKYLQKTKKKWIDYHSKR
ncbi:MAG: LytTR family transcriptional regulator [Clostridiales Family XIII bacterium]|jgi:DNA-binding LytR/AlgR family response regulator|nr:LytTR family transcriptional regulator [Clostridiales Family XIII bacterium]